MAVLFLDLDWFKRANDTYGHAVGDLLLKAATQRLQGILRKTDTLGRMGGDEFAIILEVLQGRDYADQVAARIGEEIGQPFAIEGHSITIGASVGTAIFPDDAQYPEELLKLSDQLMYEVKRQRHSNP
jgi:diguanylate cyclase (GGDEF)-like protein